MADEVHSCIFLGKEEWRRNEGSHKTAHWKSRWGVFSFQHIPLQYVGAYRVYWTDGQAVLGPLSPVLKAGLKEWWEQSLSALSPILSTSSLERWCLHSLSLQKWTKGFEAPQEEKSLQGVSALLLPWAAWQQALPHCCYPPWSKKGKRKIRLGLRSLDLPVFSWLREITSHFQSQREIFIHLSLLKEDELWLGEKTREVLPINKVSISEKYDLNSWLNEYLGSSWAPGCGICTLGFNPPCSS